MDNTFWAQYIRRLVSIRYLLDTLICRKTTVLQLSGFFYIWQGEVKLFKLMKTRSQNDNRKTSEVMVQKGPVTNESFLLTLKCFT